MKCSLCYDTGWLLEAKQKSDGAVTVELLPCLIPDCAKSGQRIELLSLNMLQMQDVARHPKDGYVMSLSNGRGK